MRWSRLTRVAICPAVSTGLKSVTTRSKSFQAFAPRPARELPEAAALPSHSSKLPSVFRIYQGLPN